MGEDRTTSRNFRIPLSLDSQVSKFKKENKRKSVSHAYLDLVKTGLKFYEMIKQIKSNPDKEKEIRKDYDEIVKNIVSKKVSNDVFENLPKETIETAFLAVYRQLKKREEDEKSEAMEKAKQKEILAWKTSPFSKGAFRVGGN